MKKYSSPKPPKRREEIGPESMDKLLTYGSWSTHSLGDDVCCLCGWLEKSNIKILFYRPDEGPYDQPREIRVRWSWKKYEKKAYKQVVLCQSCFYYFGLFSISPADLEKTTYRFIDKLPVTNEFVKDIEAIQSLTILTTNQAANELGVSIRTIQLWIQQGKFPHAYKLSPGNKRNSPFRIPRTDVEQFRSRQELQSLGDHG